MKGCLKDKKTLRNSKKVNLFKKLRLMRKKNHRLTLMNLKKNKSSVLITKESQQLHFYIEKCHIITLYTNEY